MHGDEDRVAVRAADVWPDDVTEEEGIVVNWFAKEGRRVDEGECLCEIQIEKVSIDVPAPVNGAVVAIERGEDNAFTRDDTLGWIDPG